MRAAALDRRVRREARLLVREAGEMLARKPEAGDVAVAYDELAARATDVREALLARDLRRVRSALPALDELVGDGVARAPASTVRTYLEPLLTAIALALVLKAFVIEAFQIPTGSMYPSPLALVASVTITEAIASMPSSSCFSCPLRLLLYFMSVWTASSRLARACL